jgi:hypothetical protein
MPEVAGQLRGGRAGREGNSLALVDHLRGRNGDTPLLLRKALVGERALGGRANLAAVRITGGSAPESLATSLESEQLIQLRKNTPSLRER